MAERRRFALTDEQVARLKEASQPVMYIIVNGRAPSSPQERACDVWRQLGDELGFVWDTARPVRGECEHVFEAEVTGA